MPCRAPVAVRADLKDGERFLIRADEVYFRTLNANNIVWRLNANNPDHTG